MDHSSLQYHLNELTVLRAELNYLQKRQNDTLQSAALASAALVAWLETQAQLPAVATTGAFLPLAVNAILFILYRSINAVIAELVKYLRKLETELASSDLGWQRHYDATVTRGHKMKTWIAPKMAFYMLILASAAYPLLHFIFLP